MAAFVTRDPFFALSLFRIPGPRDKVDRPPAADAEGACGALGPGIPR